MEQKYEMIEKIYTEKVLPKATEIADEIKNHIIRITDAGWYYTSDKKRFAKKEDADKYLLDTYGIKDTKVSEAFGKYLSPSVVKLIEQDGMLFVIRYFITSTLKEELCVRRYNENYVNILTKDAFITRRKYTYYRNDTTYEETPIEKIKIGQFWWKFGNDFESDYWLSCKLANNHETKITNKTKGLILSIFGDKINKEKKKYIKSFEYSYAFYDYIPRSVKINKMGAKTKNIYDEIEPIWEIVKNSSIYYGGFRYKDYIILKSPSNIDKDIMFYNTKTNKKIFIKDDGSIGGATKRIYICKRDPIYLYIIDEDGKIKESDYDTCFKDTILSEIKQIFVAKDNDFTENAPRFSIVAACWAKDQIKNKLRMAATLNFNKIFERIVNECCDPRSQLEERLNSGSSLSKAFGLPNQKINIINELLPDYSADNYIALNELILTLKFFDFLNLSSMDEETFRRIIALCIYQDRVHNGWAGIPNYACIREIYDYMPNKTPKMFVKLLETYIYDKNPCGWGDMNGKYRDYLRMRDAVMKRSQNFDESAFKLIPESMIVHVNIRPYSTYNWGGEYKISVKDQTKEYQSRYGIPSCIVIEQDEEHAILELKLSPAQSVTYLHDQIDQLAKIYQKEIESESFQKALERVKPWEYEKDDLIVISPKNAEDVQREGCILRHCVGSFVPYINKGTENIMFLRRKDIPDVPYYTIAISPAKSIEQIHCYGNGGLSKDEQMRAHERSGLESYNKTYDLKSFLLSWCKHTGINASTIKESYGALGAH